MPRADAFDEVRTPFLMEALEARASDAGAFERERDAGTGECECGGRCRESRASGEAFEAEDAYEAEAVDEVDRSGDAFERYQVTEGAEGEADADVAHEAADESWEAILETEDSRASDAFETATSFGDEGLLEAEEEAPDLAYDVQDEEESPVAEGFAEPLQEAEVAITTGEFGGALRRFGVRDKVPDAALWFLSKSAAFVDIVKTLDTMYLDIDGPSVPVSWGSDFAPDANGVLTKGPHVGLRMIAIMTSVHGSSFQPYASPENGRSADLISIEVPEGATNIERWGKWVERIAHETIHAHRFASGLRAGAVTAAARVRAGIDDEIVTRTQEGAILKDLRARFANIRKFTPTTGSLRPAEVERDFFPGPLRFSYLELFVLHERLEKAKRDLRAAFRPNTRSKTADEEIKAYDAFVDRIPLDRPLADYLVADPVFTRPDRFASARFLLEYPRLRLLRRVVDARWRTFKDLDRRNVASDPELEQMRQEHAQAFFDGLAAYTTL